MHLQNHAVVQTSPCWDRSYNMELGDLSIKEFASSKLPILLLTQVVQVNPNPAEVAIIAGEIF